MEGDIKWSILKKTLTKIKKMQKLKTNILDILFVLNTVS